MYVVLLLFRMQSSHMHIFGNHIYMMWSAKLIMIIIISVVVLSNGKYDEC